MSKPLYITFSNPNNSQQSFTFSMYGGELLGTVDEKGRPSPVPDRFKVFLPPLPNDVQPLPPLTLLDRMKYDGYYPIFNGQTITFLRNPSSQEKPTPSESKSLPAALHQPNAPQFETLEKDEKEQKEGIYPHIPQNTPAVTTPTAVIEGRFLPNSPGAAFPATNPTEKKNAPPTVFTYDVGKLAKMSRFAVLKGHKNHVKAIVPLDGGRLASGSCIGEIKIWDQSTGECIRSMQVPENFGVWSIARFEGGLLASGNGDGTIMIWSVSTGQCILRATENLDGSYPSGIRAMVQLNGESFVSASDNDVIRIWNLSMGACLRTITVRPSPCDLVPLASGLFASGSADGIKLWDLSTEKCVLYIDNKIEGLQSMAAKLVPLKNNRLACTAPHGANQYYGRIAIWDLSKGKPVCSRVLVDRPREYEEEVKSLALLAEDLLVSGYNDGTVNIWDLSTGKCLKTFKLKGPVRELVCHEGLLIAAVNNDIELWK